MSDEIMDLERRWKTWGGFLKLMSYSGIAVVIALLIATGWILASGQGDFAQNWPLWLLTVVTAGVVWRTRLHLLWLLGAGAVLGWFGLV